MTLSLADVRSHTCRCQEAMQPAESHIVLLNVIRALVGIIHRSRQKALQRRALLELDDRLLKDVGITRKQARLEAHKPFWA